MIPSFFNYYKNNKHFQIKEISFNDFKTYNKKLLNEDLVELNETFNSLADYSVVNLHLNCLEKFYCLMVLRTMTHGNDFSFTLNDAVVNVNINTLLERINLDFKDVEFDYSNTKYVFNLPSNFIHKTSIDLVIDCLVRMEWPDKKYDIRHYTLKEKSEVVEKLSLPVIDIFNILKEKFSQHDFVFSKDFTFSIIDGSLLLLLRRLFYQDISSLYDFEYNCIRSLNFRGVDFDVYTLPELRIFLQLLTKELKSKQNSNELNS